MKKGFAALLGVSGAVAVVLGLFCLVPVGWTELVLLTTTNWKTFNVFIAEHPVVAGFRALGTGVVLIAACWALTREKAPQVARGSAEDGEVFQRMSQRNV